MSTPATERPARGRWGWGRLAGAVVLAGVGCGGRTGPDDPPVGAALDPFGDSLLSGRRCVSQADCAALDPCRRFGCQAARCVELGPLDCDDGDECTEDLCDAVEGGCRHVPLSRDEDGDGVRGPRPGMVAGERGSCGNDCDDTSAAAKPGGVERCDGVDNDCNGVVDDGARFVSTGTAVRVASGAIQATSGAIASTGANFAVTFMTQGESWENALAGLRPSGAFTFGPERVAQVNSDTFTGPLLWTGSVLATSWEDRRDQNFEIYFNRFDLDGQKLGPDVRLSVAEDFSLHSQLLWTGSSYVVLWSDLRSGDGRFQIFGQRVDADGRLIGANVPMTPLEWSAEAPALAEGRRGLGLLVNAEGDSARRLLYRPFDFDLQPTAPEREVATGAGTASLTAVGDRFIASWDEHDVTPGDAIWAAVLDPAGSLRVPPRRVTEPAPFARSHAVHSLGDRVLLVWAEERGGTYDLYSKLLSTDLDELAPAEQLTFSPSDAVAPAIAVGPDGVVGVLFDDRRAGSWEVYYTRLECIAGPG